MSDLIHNLGIDVKTIIAQIINFAILLFLLKKFAYKPILSILNERKNRIEKNIEHAKTVETKMAEIEKLKEEVLAHARIESEQIIKKAELSAQRVQQEVLSSTHLQSEKLLKETEKKIEAERAKIFEEVKNEIALLVVTSVERTVGDILDEGAQKKLVTQTLDLISAG